MTEKFSLLLTEYAELYFSTTSWHKLKQNLLHQLHVSVARHSITRNTTQTNGQTHNTQPFQHYGESEVLYGKQKK